MSLSYVVEKSTSAGTDAWAEPTLSIESTGTARWFDPTSQHVTWALRLTNAGDHPITDLAARFTYAAEGGSSTCALSLTSISLRGGPMRTWERHGYLARTYPGTIAAWETLLVTGVFTGPVDLGGRVSATFSLESSGVELATVSAEL